MALHLTRALCGRSAALKLGAGQFGSPLLASRTIVMKPMVPRVDDAASHDERNSKLGRPLSPHLTIYKYEITMVFSITHRITGMALGAYMAAFGVGALVCPHDFSYYVDVVESWKLSAPTLMAAKFILAYPFTYHLANGMRHLLWDTGKCLKIKEVWSTGYTMLAVSVGLAAILAAM
ncbi:succinate dehydrogenase cytochrome b560 subunit, mitochondrial-like isoform X1 [Phlebotomus papatasi]|uniref:succinate dehydrogenase cytochrome b560 subunit, mitochondrial-like isoform X1 n=1 Tax=Phlebotomus papatasi TaxID=29031 RepID=UPI0024840E17|nr:succinate dehydrogenase cytochrome b560 subunit, mitochondrial-like isoform X1 [Phlebotomus papatasi]